MDTTDYTNKAPYLQDKEEIEQITVDAYYHNDLVKISKLTKEYFEIFDFPMDKTKDELLKMYTLKTKIKKLL